MKRSLKPTDLRDMTVGQLQVIVNDLHSQIESEWTHTPMQYSKCRHRVSELYFQLQKWARKKMGKNIHAYWPLPCSVDVKVLVYMLVSSKNCTKSQLPQSIYWYHTVHWSLYSGMNNLSSYIKLLQKSPQVQASFYLQNRFSLQNLFCWCLNIFLAEGKIAGTCDMKQPQITAGFSDCQCSSFFRWPRGNFRKPLWHTVFVDSWPSIDEGQ